MRVKQTYSITAVWRPDQEAANPLSKQIASSSVEVSALKLASNGGASFVSLYDNANGGTNPSDLRWVLDAEASNPDNCVFPSPIVFKKGIFAVLEQGSGLNPQVCVAIIPAAAS